MLLYSVAAAGVSLGMFLAFSFSLAAVKFHNARLLSDFRHLRVYGWDPSKLMRLLCMAREWFPLLQKQPIASSH